MILTPHRPLPGMHRYCHNRRASARILAQGPTATTQRHRPHNL
jgi:hypothetical protein